MMNQVNGDDKYRLNYYLCQNYSIVITEAEILCSNKCKKLECFRTVNATLLSSPLLGIHQLHRLRYSDIKRMLLYMIPSYTWVLYIVTPIVLQSDKASLL